MKTTIIPGTDLACSRFIFGTASLFNAGGKKARYNLLKAAIDNGFTHFDTAPYYGFGAAERDLNQVLREHPEVTVTTKVGIYSPGGEAQPDTVVFARKAVGRFVKSVSKPTKSFVLSRAKLALEQSLKRLGRDKIDVYTLHEPEIADLKTDEWLRWLEDTVVMGKVRYFGLASTADRIAPFAKNDISLCRFLQVFDSLKDREADILAKYNIPTQVTYGYVTAARKSFDQRSVDEILTKALQRNSKGAIIVSTTRSERTSQYGRFAEAVQ